MSLNKHFYLSNAISYPGQILIYTLHNIGRVEDSFLDKDIHKYYGEIVNGITNMLALFPQMFVVLSPDE